MLAEEIERLDTGGNHNSRLDVHSQLVKTYILMMNSRCVDDPKEKQTDGEPDAESETETESTPSMNTSEDDDTVNEPAEGSVPDVLSETEPAFSGSDYQQRTIYSTEETWHDYTDTMDQMDLMIFRQQFNVRNVTAGERNEAMVRLARDHPELIAERVFEARGYDVDLSDE